ncbi:hypothetical protein C6P46_001744 [Rhodotorula mucilaginosa]|uniref:Uncharacterized protein n=1 Tax=Rhodotorula mucilaginosa TaxID=5537 RepID=A0A9P6VTF7_RHOMI|nr:hypothetical protein C6P46_001744 [Rhodotorula mucilaginosa]
MGLSKGTLGLKFMNRQAPAAASTPPPPPSSAAAAASSTTTPATSKPANPTAPTSKGAAATAATDRKTGERTAKRNENRTSVVYETSLLSFPLLSTLNKHQSTSTSSMTATYSSMPLTSAMVSGRRSFGGANVEIEKLNDPSSHQAAPEGTADTSKLKTSKRPKKADRDAALVESVRGNKNKSGSVSSSKAGGKRTADLDRRNAAGGGEEDGANKKKRRKTDELNGVPARWELDVVDDNDAASAPSVGRRSPRGGDGDERSVSSTTTTTTTAKKATAAEFARPAGFDGVRKKQAKPATGKGKGKGRMMDDEQYQWAKQGETREWDEGKSSEETDSDSDSDDDEEERMVSSSSSEESSEEDEEEDEAVMADEQRFSEAADRAAGRAGGGHSSSRGGRAGLQSKSRRGQGRR